MKNTISLFNDKLLVLPLGDKGFKMISPLFEKTGCYSVVNGDMDNDALNVFLEQSEGMIYMSCYTDQLIFLFEKTIDHVAFELVFLT